MSGRYGAQIALGALLEARRLIDDSIRAIVMQICLDERGNPIHMCGKPALEHLREHHPDARIREEDGKVTLPSLDDALANEALAAGVLGGARRRRRGRMGRRAIGPHPAQAPARGRACARRSASQATWLANSVPTDG